MIKSFIQPAPEHFHNCSLTRAGKLPQRPAQRRITSQALFNLAYSKQIQTAWSFVKRSFFGTLEFDCQATLNI